MPENEDIEELKIELKKLRPQARLKRLKELKFRQLKKQKPKKRRVKRIKTKKAGMNLSYTIFLRPTQR